MGEHKKGREKMKWFLNSVSKILPVGNIGVPKLLKGLLYL